MHALLFSAFALRYHRSRFMINCIIKGTTTESASHELKKGLLVCLCLCNLAEENRGWRWVVEHTLASTTSGKLMNESREIRVKDAHKGLLGVLCRFLESQRKMPSVRVRAVLAINRCCSRHDGISSTGKVFPQLILDASRSHEILPQVRTDRTTSRRSSRFVCPRQVLLSFTGRKCNWINGKSEVCCFKLLSQFFDTHPASKSVLSWLSIDSLSTHQRIWCELLMKTRN